MLRMALSPLQGAPWRDFGAGASTRTMCMSNVSTLSPRRCAARSPPPYRGSSGGGAALSAALRAAKTPSPCSAWPSPPCRGRPGEDPEEYGFVRTMWQFGVGAGGAPLASLRPARLPLSGGALTKAQQSAGLSGQSAVPPVRPSHHAAARLGPHYRQAGTSPLTGGVRAAKGSPPISSEAISVGRGRAAERMSFRACGEANDAELVRTTARGFSPPKATARGYAPR